MKNKKEYTILMAIFILIGVVVSTWGIVRIVKVNEQTRHYDSVHGVLYGYKVYSKNTDGTTYSLVYEYEVDNKKYYVATDYGTSPLPKKKNTKTIKYNPENPREAVISGTGTNELILLIGFMFVGIPLIFLMTDVNKKNKTEKQIRLKSMITGVLIGVVFTVIGLGFYYLMGSEVNSLSIVNTFKSFGVLILIPLLIMMAGIYAILYSLFSSKKKEVTLKVYDIMTCENGSYNVLFSDYSSDAKSRMISIYKYYVYNTKNKEKFEINKRFKLNIYQYGTIHEMIMVSAEIRACSLNMFDDKDFEETII